MATDEQRSTEKDLWPRWAAALLGLSTILLTLSTWPMWWGTETYPAIPLFNGLHFVPVAVDRVLATALFCASLVLVVTRPRWHGPLLSVFVVTLGGLILLDQHRLQPWAWMFWLEGVALLTMRPDEARRWIGWLVVSIYFWSAVSKLDAAFLSGRGPWLLEGLLQALNLNPAMIGAQRLRSIAWLFPAGELFIALGLAYKPFRGVAVWAAAFTHVTLLLTLGPFGYDHYPGVLLWNVFFLVQNIVLFQRHGGDASFQIGPWDAGESADIGPRRSSRLGKCVLLAAIVAPTLEIVGFYDHWLAWAVYSDRPEVVRVFIHPDERERMPVDVPVILREPITDQDWCEISLDQWSFQSRFCPVYPQGRYRLALARILAEHVSTPDGSLFVYVADSPNRWTGRREPKGLLGRSELDEFCQQFWVGTQSR